MMRLQRNNNRPVERRASPGHSLLSLPFFPTPKKRRSGGPPFSPRRAAGETGREVHVYRGSQMLSCLDEVVAGEMYDKFFVIEEGKRQKKEKEPKRNRKEKKAAPDEKSM